MELKDLPSPSLKVPLLSLALALSVQHLRFPSFANSQVSFCLSYQNSAAFPHCSGTFADFLPCQHLTIALYEQLCYHHCLYIRVMLQHFGPGWKNKTLQHTLPKELSDLHLISVDFLLVILKASCHKSCSEKQGPIQMLSNSLIQPTGYSHFIFKKGSIQSYAHSFNQRWFPSFFNMHKKPTQKPCKLTYKMAVKACYYLSNERSECPLKGWVRSSTGLVVKG